MKKQETPCQSPSDFIARMRVPKSLSQAVQNQPCFPIDSLNTLRDDATHRRSKTKNTSHPTESARDHGAATLKLFFSNVWHRRCSWFSAPIVVKNFLMTRISAPNAASERNMVRKQAFSFPQRARALGLKRGVFKNGRGIGKGVPNGSQRDTKSCKKRERRFQRFQNRATSHLQELWRKKPSRCCLLH